ncbi:MAG TPA: hydroxyacid dehydrogenase [Candidatus Copromonas avistercoris]|nr:hydroxyacid dehydrogenase [Candidatus Copromonas avistercoris]
MEHLSAGILKQLPAADLETADRLLKRELSEDFHKIVVLDDDPTGVQTVHDVSVYTDWSMESIAAGFREDNKVFYILTNSRGMTREETETIHKEIGEAVVRVSKEQKKPFLLISRSDSTLRGHYPLETETLRACLEKGGIHADGEIITPYFKDGGRFTIGNVHYVKQGDELVPAAETEFARDKTFGYTHSSLPEYIEEKTNGRYPAESVTCISLEDLRGLRLDQIEEQLMRAENFEKICVNAADDVDLTVFSIALYRAVRNGKYFIFRSAAGLVKVMGGISDRPLLTRTEMIRKESGKGGLVVVGSHTEKTTEQLSELLKLKTAVPIAFDSDKVLEGEEAFAAEIRRCVKEEEQAILEGKTAVCYTRRKLLSFQGDTKEEALLRSLKISEGVQGLVSGLSVPPAFLIAKGGITSSDIGTKALKVRRAEVMGQILPGIPVWKTGPESRFPEIPYVIFPGNVGSETDLRRAVEILEA